MLPIRNEKFLNFAKKVQQSYLDITYHNKTHATDLAQTFYYLCTECELKKKCQLDSWDMLSYILAGACHDIGHPGYNNIYLIEKKDAIAIRYNDQSVLENFHVATTFEILSNDNYNIFVDLPTDDYKRVRKQMIGAILATDMALHFSKMGILKGKLENEDLDPVDYEEKKFICEQIFHLCDISNVSKPFDLCEKWTNLLFIEFFKQGDSEKLLNHNVSQFMDRTTTNIAGS